MTVKLLAVVLLNLIDLIGTVAIYGKIGYDFETNPVARMLLFHFGTAGIVALKLSMLILALMITWYVFTKNPRMASLALNVFIAESFFAISLILVSLMYVGGTLWVL